MPNFLPIRDRSLLYWAVLEHYRSWVVDDGVERIALGQQNGVMSAQRVRSIALKYRVNRGIYTDTPTEPQEDQLPEIENNSNAQGLADLLNNAANDWPDDLVARANRCVRLATDAEENEYTNGRLLSAMTKLMWFLRPTGWTMFDRFASNALTLHSRNKTLRFDEFYQVLTDLDFGNTARTIQVHLNAQNLADLFGERVIDKFLMLAGAPNRQWSEGIVDLCNNWLELLPQEIAASVRAAASNVARDPQVMTFVQRLQAR